MAILILQSLILSPTPAVRAVALLLLELTDDAGPARVAVVQRVEPLGEQGAGDLAVLSEGAGRLGLHHDARGDVFELDGGGGFVLGLSC